MRQNHISFRKEWKEAISGLQADERLTIYDAVFGYAFDGTTAELTGAARIVFSFIKSDIDHEAEEKKAKDKKSEKMRQLAMKRWYKENPAYAHVDANAYAHVDAEQKSADTSYINKINNENINTEEDINIQDNNIENKEESGKKKEKTPAKPSRTLSSTIETRKEDFYNSLVPFVDKYGKDMIRDFFGYWSEYNKSHTKMRFELEKTWETPRRLVTWASRDDKFKTKTNGNNNIRAVNNARDERNNRLAAELLQRYGTV